jgi:6-phosphogluconolactonase
MITIEKYKNTVEIAEAIAGILKKLNEKPGKDPVHISLSGGNTPKAIFKYLNEKYGKKLASERFHFWWGDDRCVPPTHPDSNYKWANELWLEPIGIAPENIHRVIGENDASLEAARYANEIKNTLPNKNGIPVFDLIILGLGDDGHTASIFPKQMELLTAKELCAVATNPYSGQIRVSFTGKLINNAKHVVFLATGENKAEKAKEVIVDKNEALPASHIQPVHGQISWILDQSAAKLLI